jgi:hypothetical protein
MAAYAAFITDSLAHSREQQNAKLAHDSWRLRIPYQSSQEMEFSHYHQLKLHRVEVKTTSEI